MPGDLDTPAALDRMADFLGRHERVLVLTGAGISTSSGIPGYRDEEGVRRGTPPTQGPEFRKSQAARKRYWARSMVGYPLLSRAQPNAAHLAIAELTQAGMLRELITQNVDGLHQRAGSTDVLELHGNIHGVVCLDCHARFSRASVQSVLEKANPALLGASALLLPDGDAQLAPEALTQFHEPGCVHCGGTLKPDVVFFGDGVPAACTTRAGQMMDDADALLVVGSSLMVFSGFRFCRMAAQAGKPIAAVNLGKTRADDMLSVKVEDALERFLPLLQEFLMRKRRMR